MICLYFGFNFNSPLLHLHHHFQISYNIRTQLFLCPIITVARRMDNNGCSFQQINHKIVRGEREKLLIDHRNTSVKVIVSKRKESLVDEKKSFTQALAPVSQFKND